MFKSFWTQPPPNAPTISPSRLQLSDGTNCFGRKVTVSNFGASNIYALTILVDVEDAAVPINSVVINTSNPQDPPEERFDTGEPRVSFEYSLDFVGPSIQCRFIGVQVLRPKEPRFLWIRGTVLTNSFANLSILQSFNDPPIIKYDTNGQWMWPMLASNSPFWKRATAQPMNLDIGGQMDVSNRFKIPSHP
jgi:hypothetical protein